MPSPIRLALTQPLASLTRAQSDKLFAAAVNILCTPYSRKLWSAQDIADADSFIAAFNAKYPVE